MDLQIAMDRITRQLAATTLEPWDIAAAADADADDDDGDGQDPLKALRPVLRTMIRFSSVVRWHFFGYF